MEVIVVGMERSSLHGMEGFLSIFKEVLYGTVAVLDDTSTVLGHDPVERGVQDHETRQSTLRTNLIQQTIVQNKYPI